MIKNDVAGSFCVQSMVPAYADVSTWPYGRAALSDQNGPGQDQAASIALDS